MSEQFQKVPVWEKTIAFIREDGRMESVPCKVVRFEDVPEFGEQQFIGIWFAGHGGPCFIPGDSAVLRELAAELNQAADALERFEGPRN